MNMALILVILFVLFLFIQKRKEHYNMGAITQLVAKGPQDTYLTGDAWKYIPPYYYGWRSPWHMPTRVRRRFRYYPRAFYRPYF